MKQNAPIALFVYNRPDHARKTVEALLANEGAGESDLFVFSDAPQNCGVGEEPGGIDGNGDWGNVRKVREYIRTIVGFKSITITERARNQGPAKSIVDGVTEIVNKYKKIIVLEDDVVTSPYFLRFMNEALGVYEDKKNVWMISGYCYPIRKNDLPETFFIKFAPSWGWGTWIDRWEKYERDTDGLMGAFTPDMRKVFNVGKGNFCFGQLEGNRAGKINTWLVFWYAKMFLSGGLCLFPRESFTKNIGMDGSGVNCGTTEFMDVDIKSCLYPVKWSDDIAENKIARGRLAKIIKTENYFMRIASRIVMRTKRRGLFGMIRYYVRKYVKRG